MNSASSKSYGTGDASFQAAGGEDGLRQLVDKFFDRMGSGERMEQLFVPAEAVRRHCSAIRDRIE